MRRATANWPGCPLGRPAIDGASCGADNSGAIVRVKLSCVQSTRGPQAGALTTGKDRQGGTERAEAQNGQHFMAVRAKRRLPSFAGANMKRYCRVPPVP